MTESAPLDTQQITAFADQTAGWTTDILGSTDATFDNVATGDAQLGSFLERPLRQSTQTWSVGQPFFYQFNPWKDFFENPYVSDKTRNYELARCKMHIKAVISGTKFHYGRCLASYNPFKGFDTVTVERNFIQQDLIQASQKPHFFLNPTKNSGGELCLPFFWDRNYLSLTDADYDNMGEVTIKSFDNLLHANSGNDPVTITIYMWAEDITLTMPTSTLPPVLQSQSGRKKSNRKGNQKNAINQGDEYGTGIISKPAAAIAKAAGMLETLPVIGPYMHATEMVASKVGEVSKIFGYSRPNVVSETQIIKPNPTGNLANTDAPDAAQKLTLDSKAELTLDSRTVGLDGVDQMGITDLAMRESYLTTFQWAPNEGPDTMLWNCAVVPDLFDQVGDEYHLTPMAMLSQVFEKWQGSVKFRFQIVKSDFHKGRMLVRYDPSSLTSGIEYNTNYSRVIDIAEQDDFEIVVGWAQPKPWLTCRGVAAGGNRFSTVSRISPSRSAQNGVLEIDVLNDLVSPGPDAPISINVFVSMCDDIKFAAPTNGGLASLHIFPPKTPATQGPGGGQGGPPTVLPSQSGMADSTENPTVQETDRPTGSNELQTIAAETQAVDHTYDVYYGDPPTTIRELMKRYTFTRAWAPPTPADATLQLNELLNKDAPYHSGWDPDGIDVSEVDGTTRLSVVNTSFYSWFAPAFAGQRGSFRKKYLFEGAGTTCPRVVRGANSSSGNGNYTLFTINPATASNRLTEKTLTNRVGRMSANGSANTNCIINNTIETELPFYRDTRFSSPRLIGRNALATNSHRLYTKSGSRDSGPTSTEKLVPLIEQWDAVGEDFTLFFFVGCPIIYSYNAGEGA